MQNIKQTAKIIILGLILSLGVGYMSAQTSTWQNPPGTPPTCPEGYAGCDAPINVGTFAQTKTGILTLLHLITPDLTITNPDGTVTGIPDGSVLVADGDNTGKVKWGSSGEGSGTTLLFTGPTPRSSSHREGTINFPIDVLSICKEVFVWGTAGDFMIIPTKLNNISRVSDLADSGNFNPSWTVQTFSGDDSGYIEISFVDGYTAKYHTYRKGVIDSIYCLPR